MTHDDRLDGLDSVGAHDLGARHHSKLTDARTRGLSETSPKPSRDSRVGITQDDEHVVATLQSADSRSPRGGALARDHEIDGSTHRAGLVAAGPVTTSGPLSVRRNASSCRSSTGLSRSGRSSLCPVAAAGARL